MLIHGVVIRASDSFDPRQRLHENELHLAQRYRHRGRRRQFLLGRAAARRLLVSSKTVDPKRLGWIERTESGWPRVLDIHGEPLDISLSISHSGPMAVCVLCPVTSGTVGVDLEMVEERIDAFYEDYFSQQEQTLMLEPEGSWSHSRGTVLWVIKEAVLKSFRVGLQVDARTVDVKDISGPARVEGWYKALVHVAGKASPSVIWRWMDSEKKMVLALSLQSQGVTVEKNKEIDLDWQEYEI